MRAPWAAFLGVLALGGCGATSAIYSGPAPTGSVAVVEGYSRFWGASSERAEIVSADRLAGGGIARASLGNVTRAQLEPGERCIQLEFKNCGVGKGSCGETTSCAFTDYFVAGQHVQLKPGSLKLDKAGTSGNAAVNATLQIEISSPGFATKTRRINLMCGSAIQGACKSGTPALPRQSIR